MPTNFRGFVGTVGNIAPPLFHKQFVLDNLSKFFEPLDELKNFKAWRTFEGKQMYANFASTTSNNKNVPITPQTITPAVWRQVYTEIRHNGAAIAVNNKFFTAFSQVTLVEVPNTQVPY